MFYEGSSARILNIIKTIGEAGSFIILTNMESGPWEKMK